MTHTAPQGRQAGTFPKLGSPSWQGHDEVISGRAVGPAPGLKGVMVHTAALFAAIAGGLLAHEHSRPVTAALAFIFAVVLVATRHGLRGGLAAGVLVSVLYNLLLSDPFLRFGLRSVDDLVPLLAFNVSAVASAYVAGRLKDQARAGEQAQRRVEALLTFSQSLQGTLSLEDMLAAAHQSAPELQVLELHLTDRRVISTAPVPALQSLASQMRDLNCSSMPAEVGRTVLCERFSEGLIVATVPDEHATDAAAHLAIIAIAAERWVLTNRLVEADVFRQSEQFKTALLSSVSHDLRTPLAVISASAGSLLRYRDKLSAEAQQDLLETIEQQSTRLDLLTGKLLSLGRIEGGIDRSAMPRIDALEVLGEALLTFRQISGERRLTKAIGLDHAPVRADASLLHQIVLNVLENAAVHTPGDANIHLSVDREENDIFIRVDDDGPGIAGEEAERIFERFRQGRAAADHQRGSGLGLSIARGFARAIGGDVSAGPRADGGRGSRFEIRLPMEDQSR